MKQADVIADGAGVVVRVHDDLLEIHCLLLVLKTVQLNTSSNNMHGQGNLTNQKPVLVCFNQSEAIISLYQPIRSQYYLTSTAVSSSEDPILVNDWSSAEVCCSDASYTPQRHLPGKLSITSLGSSNNATNTNLVHDYQYYPFYKYMCRAIFQEL